MFLLLLVLVRDSSSYLPQFFLLLYKQIQCYSHQLSSPSSHIQQRDQISFYINIVPRLVLINHSHCFQLKKLQATAKLLLNLMLRENLLHLLLHHQQKLAQPFFAFLVCIPKRRHLQRVA